MILFWLTGAKAYLILHNLRRRALRLAHIFLGWHLGVSLGVAWYGRRSMACARGSGAQGSSPVKDAKSNPGLERGKGGRVLVMLQDRVYTTGNGISRMTGGELFGCGEGARLALAAFAASSQLQCQTVLAHTRLSRYQRPSDPVTHS